MPLHRIETPAARIIFASLYIDMGGRAYCLDILAPWRFPRHDEMLAPFFFTELVEFKTEAVMFWSCILWGVQAPHLVPGRLR